MANTFELISAVTVGSGGASSIDFTSIPSTYTDLCVKLSLRGTTTSASLLIEFNGVSTDLSSRQLRGDGASATSQSSASQILISGGKATSSSTSSTFSNVDVYVPNYASTSNFKLVSVDAVNENNATTANMSLNAGLWSANSAITQITFTSSFAEHSTAYLYGVKNA